jgi:hypothetical protein
MTTATHTSSGQIEKKIETTYIKMENLYAYARILRSELDLSNGRYSTHTSAIQHISRYSTSSFRVIYKIWQNEFLRYWKRIPMMPSYRHTNSSEC